MLHDSFIAVSSKKSNPNKLKVNGLYLTLAELARNKSDLLSDVEIIDGKKDKMVFYLQFKKAPIHQIFDKGYQFTNRHLTIHSHFKEKNKDLPNGLSIAHYTEIYQNFSEEKQIVIHIYFSKQGSLHTQIKEYADGNNNKNFVILPVNKIITDLSRENVQDAKILLQKLLLKNYSYYSNFVQEADTVSTELEKISRNLTKDTKDKYIKTAKKFISIINNINDFSNEATDRRGSLMEQRIAFLENEDFTLPENVLPNTNSSTTNTGDYQEAPKTKPMLNKPGKGRKLKEIVDINNLQKQETASLQKIKSWPNDIELIIDHYKLLVLIQLQFLKSSWLTEEKNDKQKNYLHYFLEIKKYQKKNV